MRATSDRSGALQFEVDHPETLARYAFGQRTAEFLICRCCGVYVAAVIVTPRGRFATININVLERPPDGLPVAQPVTYENETPAQRVVRREQRWTPVTGAV